MDKLISPKQVLEREKDWVLFVQEKRVYYGVCLKKVRKVDGTVLLKVHQLKALGGKNEKN